MSFEEARLIVGAFGLFFIALPMVLVGLIMMKK